jgi:hypothetical protein
MRTPPRGPRKLSPSARVNSPTGKQASPPTGARLLDRCQRIRPVPTCLGRALARGLRSVPRRWSSTPQAANLSTRSRAGERLLVRLTRSFRSANGSGAQGGCGDGLHIVSEMLHRDRLLDRQERGFEVEPGTPAAQIMHRLTGLPSGRGREVKFLRRRWTR